MRETDGNTAIRVTLKNQDQFDDEGCLSAPLLDRSKEWLYRHYREQYAEQLSIWNLIMQRAEILKFNGLVSYWPEKKTEKPPTKQDPPLQGRPHSQSLEPPPAPQNSRRETPSHSPRNFNFDPTAHEFVPGTETPRRISRPTSSRDETGKGFRESLSMEVTSAKFATSEDQEHGGGARAIVLESMCAVCWMRLQGLYAFCGVCGHAAHKGCVPGTKTKGDDGYCAAYCGCECGADEKLLEKPEEWWKEETSSQSPGGNSRAE